MNEQPKSEQVKSEPALERLPPSLSRHACCDLARVSIVRCICTVVTVCPQHGTLHHGSHD